MDMIFVILTVPKYLLKFLKGRCDYLGNSQGRRTMKNHLIKKIFNIQGIGGYIEIKNNI